MLKASAKGELNKCDYEGYKKLFFLEIRDRQCLFKIKIASLLLASCQLL